MTRCLIVVPRDQPEVWGELIQRYGGAVDLEIVVDRREHAVRDAQRHPPFRGTVVHGQFLAVTRW